uniref:WPP domain-interacting protein 1 n=1 Tax=Anthurium amnicola TaxID=1678845 RepID=A0A1D1Z2A2_9ARAE
MDAGEGMPGSVAGEGGVGQDSGIVEKEVPVKVETNGDLTHEEQLEKGLSEADEIGVGGAEELSPGSVGFSPTEARMNGGAIQAEEIRTLQDPMPAESPPEGMVSDTTSAPTPSTTKGFGLRRWRRIRRDLSKDGAAIADASRILKRGLSITEPSKVKNENKQKSQCEDESSVASVNSRNMQSASNSISTIKALDPDLELLGVVGGFSVGIDSENSDDRSSRFSTAASAPKPKQEGLGYGRDKNRVKNLGGKASGHAVQPRGQRGKGVLIDITKKLREDQVMFEKENSHSSVESDLRSSTAVFAQWGSTTSNGRQSEGSMNYDGENQEEAQVSEEVQAGFYKDTGQDIDDTSRDDPHADMLGKDKMEASKKCLSNEGGDPFVESIILLQAAQEALDNEVKKFGEIGREPTSPSGYTSAQFDYEETGGGDSVPIELQVIKLIHKVEHLEHELKEAASAVKAKEMRMVELEAILKESRLPKDVEDTDLPQGMFKEMESELENLFRKKIEAEVECVMVMDMVQKKTATLGDPLTLIEQQESLAEGYEEVKVKLSVAEGKAILLKRRLEELDVSCKELLETEEVIELQNRVCRFSLCCFIQFMMLFVALTLFFMQLLPSSSDVVPT